VNHLLSLQLAAPSPVVLTPSQQQPLGGGTLPLDDPTRTVTDTISGVNQTAGQVLGGQPLNNLPLSQLDNPTRAVTDTLGGVDQTVGQVSQAATGVLGGVRGSGGKDALKLRLDLNLDVDVQIKARVHGDVTLSLL
jgi:hypothetical protein